MRKILAYIRNYPPPFDGGGFYYAYHLLNELSDCDFEITILTHDNAIPSTKETLKILMTKGIKIGRNDYIYNSLIKRCSDIFKNIFLLRRLTYQGHYDWILSDTGYLQNLITYTASLGCNARRVGLVYGEEISLIQHLGGIRGFLQRFILNRFDFIIVISKFTEDLLRQHGIHSACILVYPSIPTEVTPLKLTKEDCRVYWGIPEECFVVAFIGRHIERKGIINLINAIEKIDDDRILLIVGGEGPLTKKLIDIVAERDISNKVKFFGRISEADKPYFFQAADIFATPNIEIDGDTEGFGIVFLEASYYGLPVVFGNTGGAQEAAKHGYNGTCVNGYDVEDIKAAIDTYRMSPHLLNEHSENGKRWVCNFTFHNQLVELIRALDK